MQFIDAARIESVCSLKDLVGKLAIAFKSGSKAPLRHRTPVPGGAGDRILLCMPAADGTGQSIVKLVTVFPDNAEGRTPTVQAAILAFSNQGTPVALLDGTAVTHLRTAAASALASTYLSRRDSSHLCILGTGHLTPFMIRGHCAVRAIKKVSIWGRHRGRAEQVAIAVRRELALDIAVEATDDAATAVGQAHIVCCATSSSKPVLYGKWLKAGTFVDLVGSFSPTTREADDDVVRQSKIFVDTRDGALSEAGDLLIPLDRGVIVKDQVEGELADLVTGRHPGRQNEDEVIVFKSVGTALEDLAASQHVLEILNLAS